MSVNAYEENGVTLYRVYVNLRSKTNCTIREQKLIKGITTLQKAKKEEKRIIQEITLKISRRESLGATWKEVIDKWANFHTKYPTRKFNADTLNDHVARMNNWTYIWLNKVASQITIGDARDILRMAYDDNASYILRRAIKGTINIIFKWGIEECLITNCSKSPAIDIEIEGRSEEKMPEILNLEEISLFLKQANADDHPWYPVWKLGFLSGMRSSELEGLRKEDIELVGSNVAKSIDNDPDAAPNYGIMRVKRTWKSKQKIYGPTKANYWRNVPINKELYWFFVDYLQNDHGKDEHGQRVFPILPNWRRGMQAKVLRCFCESRGLKSIKFHTIRACFATQLISSGIPATTVMKIGGWKDYKTMMIYVRLAGIEEAGATQGLKFEASASSDTPPPKPPSANTPLEPECEVVSLQNFKSKRAL